MEEYLIEVEAVREYFKEGIQNALERYEEYIQMEKKTEVLNWQN
uniref:Uncharacterized protein n=1 Tax=Klebsiella pneumoniae TaxID=573 RepID=A0A8B0SS28_KLEPN|nr:hypothetical protein [Klebsiella pneumoniae]